MKPPFPDGTITNFSPNSDNYIYSNFYPYAVMYEDITYPSNEHAYQASKGLDIEMRMSIMRCGTAAAAKKAGQNIKLRPDWDVIKLQVMKDLVQLKFAPGGGPAAVLLASGNVHLIEGNYWHDLYWGQCFCKRHNWEGNNQLGRLIMDQRTELEKALGVASGG